MSKGMENFKLAVEDAKSYQSWYQDEDFQIRLSWEEPTKDRAGHITVCAPDLQLDFDMGELQKAVSLSCGMIIRSVEVEVENGFEYWPELMLQYTV